MKNTNNLIRHAASVPLTALLIALPFVADAAQVYKCVDKSGKTEYQSQPCPESSRSVDIDIRQASPFSVMPPIGANTDIRSVISGSCVSSVGSKSASLQKLSVEQPHKLKSFCECVADFSLSDMNKFKQLAASGNQRELERLGMNAAFACSSHLIQKDAPMRQSKPKT